MFYRYHIHSDELRYYVMSLVELLLMYILFASLVPYTSRMLFDLHVPTCFPVVNGIFYCYIENTVDYMT